ncbi:MAG: hypothetical protein AB7T49_15435 [Oligoflexales bacterium]
MRSIDDVIREILFKVSEAADFKSDSVVLKVHEVTALFAYFNKQNPYDTVKKNEKSPEVRNV